MQLKELEDFRLSDAVRFHDNLNPVIWQDEHLRPEVRKQLLVIAQDFVDYLGIPNLDIKDITLSGSNAAYTYTPHSDIDLHILVDIKKLRDDEVYRELFTSKKLLYNDKHDIKIHGFDVELYVQDSAQPVKSLGEYSVTNDRWIKIPTKRRSKFDEQSTQQKFMKLVQLSELALRSHDRETVESLLATIRKYRQAGLDEHGEFGPENLAFKILRSRGIVDQLYRHLDDLHSEKLSLPEDTPLDKPTLSPQELAKKHSVPLEDIFDQLLKGINVELEHTTDESVAREIALDHLGEDPRYYSKLKQAALEGASGYIPSNAERNDPRFKTGLTVDVKPNSIKQNAKKLGLGNIHRSGVPQTMKSNGKVT